VAMAEMGSHIKQKRGKRMFKVQCQDEAAKQAKTISDGTPIQLVKSVQDVQDLSGIQWIHTPSLK
jgi:hypothetical protein